VLGLEQAGKLAGDKAWNPDTNTLTVPVQTSSHLYGEVASGSRMPIYWSVESELTLQIGSVTAVDKETRERVCCDELNEAASAKLAEDGVEITEVEVRVTGLHTEPSAQALGWYEAIIETLGAEVSIDAEMAEGYKFLQSNYKKGKNLKQQDGKISEILHTCYGSNGGLTAKAKAGAIYAAINSKGEWPMVFYSLITAAPNTIDKFVFYYDAKGNERVKAEVSPYTREGYIDPRYKEWGMAEKATTMGAQSLTSKTDFELNFARGKAPSGMNFAQMMARGNSRTGPILVKNGIEAGEPKELLKLFSHCTEQSISKCTGSAGGRVKWTEDKPITMTANPPTPREV
jgi:hypothetical protein